MLKKTALSCAASPFTTVPQRDCHQPPSSHSPENESWAGGTGGRGAGGSGRRKPPRLGRLGRQPA
ncbi:hypothetical protein E9168_24045, partial [Klebsiella pneumoniae subsp. pneumoniae]